MSGNGLNAMENLVRASPGLRELSVSERPVHKQDESGRKMGRGKRKIQKAVSCGKKKL